MFKCSPAVARDRGDNLQLIEKQLQPQEDCVDWVRSTWQEVEREIPVATREDELETGQEHWDRSAFVFVYGKFVNSVRLERDFPKAAIHDFIFAPQTAMKTWSSEIDRLKLPRRFEQDIR